MLRDRARSRLVVVQVPRFYRQLVRWKSGPADDRQSTDGHPSSIAISKTAGDQSLRRPAEMLDREVSILPPAGSNPPPQAVRVVQPSRPSERRRHRRLALLPAAPSPRRNSSTYTDTGMHETGDHRSPRARAPTPPSRPTLSPLFQPVSADTAPLYQPGGPATIVDARQGAIRGSDWSVTWDSAFSGSRNFDEYRRCSGGPP